MRFKAVIAIAIVTIFILSSIVIVGKRQEKMSDTLYEYYNVGDNGWKDIYYQYGNKCWAQTFKVGNVGANKAYTITSVKVKICRSPAGSPEGVIDILIGIYATDVTGKPTGYGLDLIEANGNLVLEDMARAGAWYEYTFPSPIIAQPNNTYAIVIKAPYANYDDNSNQICWRHNNTGTYTGGSSFQSVDNGHTWTAVAGDLMFEVYGTLFQ